MPESREMYEYDEDEEMQIRARIEAGLNQLNFEQARYLLDQLDLARLSCAEAGRLTDQIEANVTQAKADWAEIADSANRAHEQIKRAREAHAEDRAGAAEDRNIIGGLHSRIRKMEGEMQAELDVLRKVAVAAAQYRAVEETPLAGEGMIQLMGSRQVLDDALLEWVEFKGFGPKDFDSNG